MKLRYFEVAIGGEKNDDEDFIMVVNVSAGMPESAIIFFFFIPFSTSRINFFWSLKNSTSYIFFISFHYEHGSVNCLFKQ